MEKYRFEETERTLLEGSCIPFAVYQFIDKRVVTILLSDGFLELFGYADRDYAVDVMDNDMYKETHPDDAARIADAAFRFAIGIALALWDIGGTKLQWFAQPFFPGPAQVIEAYLADGDYVVQNTLYSLRLYAIRHRLST